MVHHGRRRAKHRGTLHATYHRPMDCGIEQPMDESSPIRPWHGSWHRQWTTMASPMDDFMASCVHGIVQDDAMDDPNIINHPLFCTRGVFCVFSGGARLPQQSFFSSPSSASFLSLFFSITNGDDYRYVTFFARFISTCSHFRRRYPLSPSIQQQQNNKNNDGVAGTHVLKPCGPVKSLGWLTLRRSQGKYNKKEGRVQVVQSLENDKGIVWTQRRRRRRCGRRTATPTSQQPTPVGRAEY